MTWSCNTNLTSLTINNLPESLTEEDLYDLFGAYGEITRTGVSIDQATGECTGKASVEFENEAAAKKAYQEKNNCLYLGHTLNLRLTHPRFPVAECTIKISNLPKFITLRDVERAFDCPYHPSIVRSILVTDRPTWNNEGAFAMLEFKNAEIAQMKRKDADGETFDGVIMKIDVVQQSIDIDSLLAQ